MVPSLWFMVMGLVARLSLASHLAHQIRLVTQGLPDGARVTRPMSIAVWGLLGGWLDILSPPSSFWPCLNSSGFVRWHLLPPIIRFYPEFCPLVFRGSSVFLIGPSAVRQFRQAVIIMPGQGRWFPSLVPSQ